MTDIPTVTVALPEDRTRLLDTLVLGFAADPMARWLAPDANTYLRLGAALFDAFGGKAFEHGTAYTANDGAAVALWLPPGVEGDDEAMMETSAQMVPPEALGDMAAVFGEMETYNPQEACWYLPLIAADPAHLGQGLGGALMKHATAVCDEQGLPAYLESSNIRNVSLYQRHGFEVMGEIQHGSSPVLRPMYRAAR